MKKVAILSFQHAYNYGAVFQVAALQHIISELGYDCDIIDYRSEGIEKQYRFRHLYLNKSLINNLRANLVLLPFLTKKKINFQKWMHDYKATKPMNRGELRSIADKYDKFVVGSDQVWNFKCNGDDSSFMLDFVPKEKRIAYAASIGYYEIPNKYKHWFETFIHQFKHISVREKRAGELVEPYMGGEHCCVCVDPVFLVGRKFWEMKMAKQCDVQEPYIFVYQLGHSNYIPKYLKQLKKQEQYKIVYVTGHIGNIVKYSFQDKNLSSTSPENFLYMLVNAKYVVTNSFHATVLSLIFKKNFWVVNSGGNGAATNNRLYSLLDNFGLSNRIVSNFEKAHLTNMTDFSNFDNLYKKMCLSSMEYLKTSLDD